MELCGGILVLGWYIVPCCNASALHPQDIVCMVRRVRATCDVPSVAARWHPFGPSIGVFPAGLYRSLPADSVVRRQGVRLQRLCAAIVWRSWGTCLVEQETR